MAPVGNISCLSVNATTDGPINLGKDDMNALLYIVVTLLFYSMGIIIGIITYLKREQADMEEDKLFDTYMQFKREPFNLQKKERVQQMAMYLKQLEEQKASKKTIDSCTVSENKQMRPYLHRDQSCHRYQHYPCTNHIKTAPISGVLHNRTEGNTFATSETERAEQGLSTSLLCSLTFGMCEPLLATDTIKRVTFPFSPTDPCRNLAANIRRPSLSHASHSQTYKGAIKNSRLSVHYSNNDNILSKDLLIDLKSCSETKVPFVNCFSNKEKYVYAPNVFSKTDIEMLDLRHFQHARESVFKEKSDRSSSSTCNASNISSSKQESALQFIHASEKIQPNMKTEGRELDCPDQSLCGRKSCLTKSFSDERVSLVDKQELKDERVSLVNKQGLKDERVSLVDKQGLKNERVSLVDKQGLKDERVLCQMKTNAIQNKVLTMSSSLSDSETDNAYIHDRVHQQTKLVYNKQGQQNSHAEHNTQIFDMILPEDIKSQVHTQQSTESYSILKCDPLLKHDPSVLPFLFNHQRQLRKHQCVARPKTFPGTKTLNIQEVNAYLTSSDNILSQSRERTQDMSHLPWERSNSQNFDIPDLAEHKLKLKWKNKPIDKKCTPRSQPERRGALFFTQRAHQKEPDSSTLSIDNKESSSTSVSNQREEIDSQNTRKFQMSNEI